MLKIIKPLILSGLLGMLAFTGKARTYCSGGVPLSSNLGIPPGTKGIWQFNISYDQNALKTLKTGAEKLIDNSREEISFLLRPAYGYD